MFTLLWLGDVISYLVRQEVDGKPISDTAVMEMVTLLIAGGVGLIQPARHVHARPVTGDGGLPAGAFGL